MSQDKQQNGLWVSSQDATRAKAASSACRTAFFNISMFLELFENPTPAMKSTLTDLCILLADNADKLEIVWDEYLKANPGPAGPYDKRKH